MSLRSFLSSCVLAILGLATIGSGARAAQSIALILDASGSMNAVLPEGRTRIEAAKAAVAEIVGKLPEDVRVSLRAYGHQSPTSKHDCRDTALLVGFAALSSNKAVILEKTEAIQARGYTPITYVLKLAAEDVGKEEGKPRVVILVSDGKETCAGDPCATAKALADADAALVVHTIGFAVDVAARYQLQCIARVARGKYFDADSAGNLAAALGEAVKAAPLPPKKTQIVVTKPNPGKLKVRSPNIMGHQVTEAETGKKVGSLSPTQSVLTLPPGFYNVAFSKAVWKSVEVQAGETTVLDPGVLEIRHASITGHRVLDAETGEEIGTISPMNSSLTVLPSTFSVTFGKALWKNIEVKPGERRVLNPGVIKVTGASAHGNPIKDESGTVLASISPTQAAVPLPPGKYTLEIGGQKMPIELAEGQEVDVKVQ